MTLPIVKATAFAQATERMNKTERAYYGTRLLPKLQSGEIARVDFEAVTLRLGPDLRYTPDFRVILADGTEEYHEVKGGFKREDAWVKLRTAAEQHPYIFRLAELKGGMWTVKHVSSAV